MFRKTLISEMQQSLTPCILLTHQPWKDRPRRWQSQIKSRREIFYIAITNSISEYASLKILSHFFFQDQVSLKIIDQKDTHIDTALAPEIEQQLKKFS